MQLSDDALAQGKLWTKRVLGKPTLSNICLAVFQLKKTGAALKTHSSTISQLTPRIVNRDPRVINSDPRVIVRILWLGLLAPGIQVQDF